MGWDIKIWHDSAGEHVRMSIEASPEVPDDVMSHLSGVYWSDEVQGLGDEWDQSNPFDSDPGSRMQG